MKYLLLLLSFASQCVIAQQKDNPKVGFWQPQNSVTIASLRGIHAVNDTAAWASGSNGTVLKTTNGGLTWEDVTVPECAHLDFRDVEAFDANTAIVMNAGNGAFLYKTTDGGRSWNSVYSDPDSNLFLDGMDFGSDGFGVVFGDPIDGKMLILISLDWGTSWHRLEPRYCPQMIKEEAGFAASGTSIALIDSVIWIGTGGAKEARVLITDRSFTSYQFQVTPLRTGLGSGVFSVLPLTTETALVAGGNYADSTNSMGNFAKTEDSGLTWLANLPNKPNGYRSCLCGTVDRQIVHAVGRTGTEVSTDLGTSWLTTGVIGYYACSMAAETGWAVGRNGKIAKWTKIK